jgi:hypothetical protein
MYELRLSYFRGKSWDLHAIEILSVSLEENPQHDRGNGYLLEGGGKEVI